MSCHIQVNLRPWCLCDRPAGLMGEAGRRGVLVSCEHPTGGNAVALVHMLQDLGVEGATIVDGPCEWNPGNPEFKKLRRNR